MELAPGQRVEARCTRCRDIMGHAVVALVDGRVIKVQCCICGSVHKYYPPEAPAAQQQQQKERPVRVQPGRERAEAVQSRPKQPRQAAPKAKKPDQAGIRAQMRLQTERQWQDALARNPSHPVPYAMNGRFASGSLVDHSSFGTGVVLTLTPPDKMEILFQEGVKTLRCQC